MAIIELKCSQCQCLVTPPQGGATGMHCPRCLTWLEFDPLCLGSCLSCHKMQEKNPAPCIDGADSETIAIEFLKNENGPNSAKLNDELNWIREQRKGWQELFSWMSSGK